MAYGDFASRTWLSLSAAFLGRAFVCQYAIVFVFVFVCGLFFRVEVVVEAEGRRKVYSGRLAGSHFTGPGLVLDVNGVQNPCIGHLVCCLLVN